ncbi:MAG: hypothetical protein JWR63_1782 [Conexibacter sp.]|nr:hypothetical protein [Conexibacter sp.]
MDDDPEILRELNQLAVFITARDLGRPEVGVDELIARCRTLPFEPAIFQVAQLHLSVEQHQGDAGWHHEQARQMLVGSDIGPRFPAYFAAHPTTLFFSAQALSILERLLVEHAADEPLRDLTSAEGVSLTEAVLEAHTVLQGFLDQTPLASDEERIAYEMQSNSFFHRQPLLESFARQAEFLRLAQHDPGLIASSDWVPLSVWLDTAAGLSVDEQGMLGHALGAMTDALVPTNPDPLVTAHNAADLLAKLGWPKDTALTCLAGDRGALQSALGRLDPAGQHLAWEFRVFAATPFLVLTSGDLLLLGGQWLAGWLADGFHYRALLHAQGLGKAVSLKYSRFAGQIAEAYALELARDALPPSVLILGEQVYEDKGESLTSDVAALDGADLILFEVSGRRVMAAAARSGSADEAAKEVTRMIVGKAGQLNDCIEALLAGTATLPGVDLSKVGRIIPVVVTVGHLHQTRSLWAFLDGAIKKTVTDPQVQRLQLLPMASYEVLLGVVNSGAALGDTLAARAAGPYRHRDLAVWLSSGDAEAPSADGRVRMLEVAYQKTGDAFIARLREVGLA